MSKSVVLIVGFILIASIFGSFKSNVMANSNSVDGWAVLLEMNEFPPGWGDLPVDFIDSERMQATLLSLGWQNDHMYILNTNLTIPVVQEAVEWLINKTDYDDIALLYICTHGMWMRNVLLWNDWFPVEWEKLNTSKRLLLIDTGHAEEYINFIKDDPLPHVSLACCSADEISWAGLEEEGLPIIGSVWNYYFTNALINSSADFNSDGFVSVEEAFDFSTPLVQQYMNETVFTVPEFLEIYHALGIYPENYDAYPHPVIDDQYSGQLYLNLHYVAVGGVLVPIDKFALLAPYLGLVSIIFGVTVTTSYVKRRKEPSC